MQDLLSSIAGGKFAPWRERIARFGLRQPQAMLFEGGTEGQRLEFGLYRAMAANCPSALDAAQNGAPATPCLACRVCGQIAANEHVDLFIYDGRISNKEDEENPGPIRALNMANVRELKSRMAAKPRGEGKRVVIFQGMLLNSRDSAMNGLLKNLEDPCGHTLFTLLAPQRAQILPTLVSRSLVVTLPWPENAPTDAGLAEWVSSLAAFLENGNDFLEKAGAKKSISPSLAGLLILACQHAFSQALGRETEKPSPLAKALAPLAASPEGSALLIRWMAEAQEMLLGGVNPARVLEAFSVKVYALLRARQIPGV